MLLIIKTTQFFPDLKGKIDFPDSENEGASDVDGDGNIIGLIASDDDDFGVDNNEDLERSFHSVEESHEEEETEEEEEEMPRKRRKLKKIKSKPSPPSSESEDKDEDLSEQGIYKN